MKFRLLEIGRVARAKGPINQDKLQRRYGQLLDATSRVVGQAKRFSEEIARGVKRSTSALKQLALEGLRQELDEMTSRVRQVMKQTRARIFRGNTRSEGKLLSLFEPSTEVIRKGKAGKPNEFGKMVKLQEAENQIVTDYEVYARRPYDFGPAGRSHREASGACWDARHVWWRPMLHSTPPRTRRPRRQEVSNASAFPIARPKALSGNASRGSAGSATARNGVPDCAFRRSRPPVPIDRDQCEGAVRCIF